MCLKYLKHNDEAEFCAVVSIETQAVPGRPMIAAFHFKTSASFTPGVVTARREREARFQVIALSIIFLTLVVVKFCHHLRIAYATTENRELTSPIIRLSSSPNFPHPPAVARNESFGSCLMVKGDNHLLKEWIPYHYTLLPLRYLLVASDTENPEDPNTVLQRWKSANTDLRFWVVNVSMFEHIHGEFDEKGTIKYYRERHGDSQQTNQSIDQGEVQYLAHSRLIHKQKAMVSFCAKFMKEKGVRWVSFHDTDEFLAINRIGVDEEIEHKNSGINGTLNAADEAKLMEETYGRWRLNLPRKESNATVVDVINSFQSIQQPLKSCHTMPRVSFGALENYTCPGSNGVKKFAKANFDYDFLSTQRFQQHAVKGDFSKNRFGKVFIDVGNIADHTLSMKPNNIHRPFREECIRPIPVFNKSPFYLMHYAGTWERFSSKGDARRGFDQWKELADVSDSTSCCQQEVYRWLPRFVDQVGLDRAKYLLRESASNT